VRDRLRGLQEDLQLQAGDGPPSAAWTTVTKHLDSLQKRAEQLRNAAAQQAAAQQSSAQESAPEPSARRGAEGSAMQQLRSTTGG